MERSPDHAYTCLRLPLLNFVSYHFFLYRSHSFSDCGVVDSLSDNISKAISLHPFSHIFLFSDINTQHNIWLKHSLTNLAVIKKTLPFQSFSLPQVTEFPTRFPVTKTVTLPFSIYFTPASTTLVVSRSSALLVTRILT